MRKKEIFRFPKAEAREQQCAQRSLETSQVYLTLACLNQVLLPKQELQMNS